LAPLGAALNAEKEKDPSRDLAARLASAEVIARQKENDGAASFAELAPAERRDAAEALALLAGSGKNLPFSMLGHSTLNHSLSIPASPAPRPSSPCKPFSIGAAILNLSANTNLDI
jgi:hypothetical protein